MNQPYGGKASSDNVKPDFVDHDGFPIIIKGDIGENNNNFVEISRKTCHYSDKRAPTEHVSFAYGYFDDAGNKRIKKSTLINVDRFSKYKLECMSYALALASGNIDTKQFEEFCASAKTV